MSESSDSDSCHVDIFEEAEAKAALAAKVPAADNTGGFVVVRTDKGRMRRLHFLGACHRRPDEHYHNYTFHDVMPTADQIDAKCKQCFPAGKNLTVSVRESDIESADESDSSSSTVRESKSNGWSCNSIVV